MTPTTEEYFMAACADIAYEGLDADTVMNAWLVSENAEDFFEAIQAAIWLKVTLNDHR